MLFFLLLIDLKEDKFELELNVTADAEEGDIAIDCGGVFCFRSDDFVERIFLSFRSVVMDEIDDEDDESERKSGGAGTLID